MSIIVQNGKGAQLATYDSKEYEFIEGKKGVEYDSDVVVNKTNVHTIKANGVTVKRDYTTVITQGGNWGFSQIDNFAYIQWSKSVDSDKVYVTLQLATGEAAKTLAASVGCSHYCSGHVSGWDVDATTSTNCYVKIWSSDGGKTRSVLNSLSYPGNRIGDGSIKTWTSMDILIPKEGGILNVRLYTTQSIVKAEDYKSADIFNPDVTIEIEVPAEGSGVYYLCKTNNIQINLNNPIIVKTIKFLDELTDNGQTINEPLQTE